MMRYKLRTRRLFEDAGKAPMMLRKGKLALSAPQVGGKEERAALFNRAAEVGQASRPVSHNGGPK
jgi:hypothetical protein